MALARRRPAPAQSIILTGLPVHSQERPNAVYLHCIVCRVSRRGDCYDNAVVVSIFATLNGARRTLSELRHAKMSSFDYIEVFYDQRRRHRIMSNPHNYPRSDTLQGSPNPGAQVCVHERFPPVERST